MYSIIIIKQNYEENYESFIDPEHFMITNTEIFYF